MQSPKAILYLLTFRTPQNTVSHGRTTQCRLSAANSLENTSCTKPPYFHVIQYIRVFRLHGLKKISKLPVSSGGFPHRCYRRPPRATRR
ncbi:hypothetical protein AVEN_169665-1 [Araneus ventricosus]|uniref:Uncharacterized protein n=1 Tax=Araneus ventricosus TaxID=182803 RepID=A0A4Y2D490_ARAVE|nr:hypothetical protein AVEN_169665-1 [Araneus ventricosus]